MLGKKQKKANELHEISTHYTRLYLNDGIDIFELNDHQAKACKSKNKCFCHFPFLMVGDGSIKICYTVVSLPL